MTQSRRQFIFNTSAAGLAGGAFSFAPWLPASAFSEELTMDLNNTNELSGGLPLHKDLVFPGKPDDPEMRESVNIWMFSDDGKFAFPRLALEGEAWQWDKHFYDANFSFADGRVLKSIGRGASRSPLDEHGQPTVFSGGPVTFKCLEPFRRWLVTFDGEALDGHVDDQMAGTFFKNTKTVPVHMEAELTMVTPAWVQDNSAERIASLNEDEKEDAAYMGIGYRFEHLFRGQGQLKIDGEVHPFTSTGLRIHRQSVRLFSPQWRGHCWQSAVFPDGSAFGYITYPARENGKTYNDGYIYKNGKMYPARAVKTPWLSHMMANGDDCSVELESELGIERIKGVSTLATFTPNVEVMAGFTLNQSGVLFTWGDQQAIGMMERSSLL